jgi:hypothetical protein
MAALRRQEGVTLNQIILVPHPGPERHPNRGSLVVPWPGANVPHKRKFMRADGSWMSYGQNQSGKGPLDFWCEYEPPTSCVLLHASAPKLPRYLQTPQLMVASPTLNTDPWVFAPGFVWSTCRHGSLCKQGIQPASGDIVLFGSSFGKDSSAIWVLDTVLVIHNQVSIASTTLGTSYARLVRPTLSPTVTPFVGTPATNNNGSPFSFVPAARVGINPTPFARPQIEGLFNQLTKVNGGGHPSPTNRQALVHCTATNGTTNFWTNLVSHIEKNCGLVLATELTLPSVKVAPGGQPKSNC